MTQRTGVQTMLGATLSLSATLPETYDAAGYASTDFTWTEIGEIENHGNHGGTKTIIEFTPVDTGVVTKLPGGKNYGNKSLMVGYIPGDAGQAMIETAFESTARYSAKITYPLGDGEVTNEIHYLDVIVAKKEYQDGAVNDVRKISVDLAVCRKPIVVAAT